MRTKTQAQQGRALWQYIHLINFRKRMAEIVAALHEGEDDPERYAAQHGLQLARTRAQRRKDWYDDTRVRH